MAERAGDGWSRVPLGDLCQILSGGTPPKSEPRYWSGAIPWVSGKDMKNPRLRDAIDHVSPEALEAGTRLAPAGSVFLLVRGMGLAKDLPVAVALRDMAFNQDIKALVPRDSRLGPYIRAAIYHDREQLLSRIVPSAHGTMTLNLDDVQRFEIPVPADIDNALAIARLLDVVQDRLDGERKQSAITASLSMAAMRTLFSRGTRDEALKETVVGSVPQNWTETSLGELCSIGEGAIQTGPFGSQLHARDYLPNGRPVINPTHLIGNRIEHERVPRVDEATAARLRRHQVKQGDILFGRRGEIGRHGLVSEKEAGWLCGTGCFVVRVCHPSVDNRFLSYLLSTEEALQWLIAHAAGSIMPNLNNEVLARVPVVYPTLDEQREIVAILDAIDRKIDLHRRKRAVLEELFKALLHKLMTGEIRVADLDLSALAPPIDAEAAA